MTADTINSQSSIFFNYNKIKKITIFISNIFKKERVTLLGLFGGGGRRKTLYVHALEEPAAAGALVVVADAHLVDGTDVLGLQLEHVFLHSHRLLCLFVI